MGGETTWARCEESLRTLKSLELSICYDAIMDDMIEAGQVFNCNSYYSEE